MIHLMTLILLTYLQTCKYNLYLYVLVKNQSKYQSYLTDLKKYRFLNKNSLSMGLPRFSSYFYNIQRKRYDLVFSAEGEK